jgi:hypothetical protein
MRPFWIVASIVILAGCAVPAATTPEPAHAAAPLDLHLEAHGMLGDRIGIPCPAKPTSNCTSGIEGNNTPFSVPRDGATSGTLVATWTAKTPAAARLEVCLRATTGSFSACTSGASPVTVKLEGANVPHHGDLVAWAIPPTGGATSDEEILFVLDLHW